MRLRFPDGGQKSWLSALFILVLISLPIAGGSVLPTYAARPSAHGVVNGLLRAEIARLSAKHGSSLHAQQRSAPVPIIITSSRDVSSAVRAAGGTVEADIRGKVMAARVPADRIIGLARQPGVRTV